MANIRILFLSIIIALPCYGLQLGHPLGETEGVPNALVMGHVNALTGSFQDHEVDIIVPGIEPLVYARSYCSNSNGSPVGLGHGWEPVPYTRMVVMPHHLMGAESSGSWVVYNRPQWSRRERDSKQVKICSFNIESCEKGYTNSGSGILSGRTTVTNNHLFTDPEHRKAKLIEGSGVVRLYSGDKSTLTLDTLKQPSGRRQKFSHTGLDLVRWSAWGASQTDELGHLKFLKEGALGKTIVRDSTTSVHQKLVNSPEGEYLECVERTKSPKSCYQYKQISSKGKPLLTNVSYPENRYLSISYDQEDRVNFLTAPVGQIGSPCTVASFRYEAKRTLVHDANNNLTIYNIDDHQRLQKIERYTWNGSSQNLRTEERFEWIAPGSRLVGSLCSREICSPEGSFLFREEYEYDRYGNVTTKRVKGLLNGELSTLTFTSRYSKKRSRTLGNLPIWEKMPSGEVIEREYYPKSDRLKSLLKGDGNEIIHREFYQYDKDGALIEKIVDDGTGGHSSANLDNVTTRLITRITPRNKKPCWGFPELVQEFYYEPQTGEEISLGSKQFDYDFDGNLIEEVVYDNKGIAVYQKNWTYDRHGNCLSITDPFGHCIKRAFDENDNLIQQTGPLPGQVTTKLYDQANRCVSSKHQGLYSGEYRGEDSTFNALNQVVSRTLQDGNKAVYTYGDTAHCTDEELPDVYSVTSDGHWEAQSRSKSYVYDAMGRVLSETQNGLTTQTTYNVLGEKESVLYSDGTELKWRYRADGSLAEEYYSDGTSKHYFYDHHNRLIREECLDVEGNVASFLIHNYQRSQLIGSVNALGITTHYQYDGAGRVTKEWVNSDFGEVVHQIETEYDSLGRACSFRYGLGSEAVTQIQVLDFLDRVIEERTESADNQVQSRREYLYDAAGNCIVSIDFHDKGVATTFKEYDIFGQVTKISDPLGNETSIRYDPCHTNAFGQGVLLSITIDPKGRQTITEYNTAGNVAKEQKIGSFGEDLGSREYGYDSWGNCVCIRESVTDGHQLLRVILTESRYDSMGNLVQLTQAAGTADAKSTYFVYDKNRLVSVFKQDGKELNYTYDLMGRILENSSSDGTIHDRYQYDALGRIVLVEDLVHGCATRRVYDAIGNVIREELGNGLIIGRTFDSHGRQKLLTLPDDSAIGFSFNGRDLSEVTRYDSQEKKLYSRKFLTDLSGLCKYINYESDALSITHDLMGRPVKRFSKFFSEDEGRYDSTGNLLGYLARDPEGDLERSFGYDELDQLTSEEDEHTYCYDSLYNRIEKDGERYTVNDHNQLLATESKDYAYDASGNLIRSGEINCRYDALDRLTHIDLPDGRQVHYLHDAFNRIIIPILKIKFI